MEVESAIVRNLRLRMQAKGIGAKALSLKANLNETYVRDLLTKKSRNPRQEHLQKLAAALDCRVSDLTGEARPAAAPPTHEEERVLLAAFAALSDERRQMALTMIEALARDEAAKPVAPVPDIPRRAAAPKGADPPRPTAGGNVAKNRGEEDCGVVRLPRRQVAEPERR